MTPRPLPHLLPLLCSPSTTPTLPLLLHAHLLKLAPPSLTPHFPLLLASLSHHPSLHPHALSLFSLLPSSSTTDPFIFSSLLRRLTPSLSLLLLRRFASLSLPSLDAFLFASLFRVAPSLPLARQAHTRFLQSPYSSDGVAKSSLVNAYCKRGSLSDARKVFDTFTYPSPIACTAMLGGYASNGFTVEAVEVFEKMRERSLVAWTALISGFVKSRHGFDAANIFVRMRREGVRVEDGFVLSSLVSTCADMAALGLGRQMHSVVVVLGFEKSEFVGNSLVDMYSKCTDVCSARVVFESMRARDVVSWTTMIVGEAQHGRPKEVFDLFDRMVHDQVRPNEVTFVALLYACSHSGLVQKGREIFDSMVKDYRIKPVLQHYTCLLDLLSRSGLLEEAEDVINTMPCEPDEPTWAALLSACKKHNSSEMSLRFADHLLSLRPREPSTYILLSNVYAVIGKWDCVANVRKLMVDMEIKKETGYSWIEMGKESFMFQAGEVPHDMSNEIIELLNELAEEMRKRGYVPDTSFVMHDLDEQEKLQQLSRHSERIAVAFGILKSVPGSIIRVVKNLRVCGDCHTVLKLVSEIVGREFVVRDANRFHHFKSGKCSCGDFW